MLSRKKHHVGAHIDATHSTCNPSSLFNPSLIQTSLSRFPSIWQLSLTLSNQESTFVVMLVNQEKSKSAVKNN